MPRKLYPIVCLVILSFCLGTSALANPVLTIGSGTGVAGSDVTINVTADNLSASTQWGFKLAYDRDRLDFVTVAAGAATADWPILEGEIRDGKLKVWGFAGVVSGTPVSGSGQVLCRITFHLKSGSVGTFSLTPSSPADDLEDASLNPGKITINAPTPLALTVGSGAGLVGADVTIAVTADGVKRMDQWGFNLNYDKSKLGFVSVAGGAATADWGIVDGEIVDNKLKVWGTAGPSGTEVIGNGQQICKITLRIRSGAGGTTFSLTPSSPSGGLNDAALKAGVLKITPPTPLALTIGSVTGLGDADVTIAVTADGVKTMDEWGFRLSYDKSRLGFVSAQTGTATSDWGIIDGKIEDNKLKVWGTAGALGTAVNGNAQQLCQLRFHIKAGTGATTLTLTPSSPSGDLGNAALKAGKVVVSAPLPLALKIGSATGFGDADVTIAVTADDVKNMDQWGFRLDYDKSKLGFVTVATGTATADWGIMDGGIVDNKLKVWGTAGALGSEVSGNGQQICRITLRIKAGTGATTLTLTPSSPSGGLTGAALKAGKVIVSAPLPLALTIGSGTAAVGADVTIAVTADGVKAMTKWGFRLDYDKSRLGLVAVQSGTATADWGIVDGVIEDNKLKVWGTAGALGSAVSGNGQQLCRIVLRVKSGDGGTTLALTPSSPVDGLKDAKLKAGVVTVAGPAPLTLTVGSATGNVGTTVTVAVTASGLSGSTAWGFRLAFDTNQFAAGPVRKGTATNRWTTITSRMEGGKLRVDALAGSGTALSGRNLELCKIQFYIKTQASRVAPLTPSDAKLGLNGARLKVGQITLASTTLVGRVEIQMAPEGGAAWTLKDGQGKLRGGSGNAALERVPAGEVTLNVNALAGCETPAAMTEMLAADGVASFLQIHVPNSTQPASRRRALVLRYLLGLDANPAGLDANGDQKVDVGDLFTR